MVITGGRLQEEFKANNINTATRPVPYDRLQTIVQIFVDEEEAGYPLEGKYTATCAQ